MPSAVFPEDFLTERLRALRIEPAHLPFIMEMHANAEVMASMGGTRDETASRRYVDGHVAHWTRHGYGMYILHDRATGLPAGRAGLKANTADEQAVVELAYALHPASWGKGYAQEISRALVALGFKLLPIDALQAVALRSNAASRRVLEKAGLRYVGTTNDLPEPKFRYEVRRAGL
ncbi:GNAT family N-acetyltransferase [Bordetella sp. LUAb4]|uniref:GNAT family N-acetyltransferase n=1 Tax=Bordetella sp. LUAb4 TaxID=2843195 RepID=UPI001E2CB527|nr:GNAT family N-acetyltransferase [Bordetella sp. LUAb4]